MPRSDCKHMAKCGIQSLYHCRTYCRPYRSDECKYHDPNWKSREETEGWINVIRTNRFRRITPKGDE